MGQAEVTPVDTGTSTDTDFVSASSVVEAGSSFHTEAEA
ncbi:MAG: hypothetical protein BTN85_1976 [Candidatus Methanohalarchaeum thermophilum]|uniref:Uncharacterized protein n=1 Tax=Methanohalarchaeum thermophilum TaxID=1903181 RepID=A0A1Q6DSH9_METT1|nr:MAG: hypothetical protein BTN85_1976 [Candidatus Methanohalarchaeum thermophilum]